MKAAQHMGAFDTGALGNLEKTHHRTPGQKALAYILEHAAIPQISEMASGDMGLGSRVYAKEFRVTLLCPPS